MKRVAFSVWPYHEGNKPKEEVTRINEMSKKVLVDFEHQLETRFEPFDRWSELLFEGSHSPYTVKDYTNWSDYIRVVRILELFEQGYDEVLYFDYDLLIFEQPTSYGCAIEGHFEGDDTGDIESTFKFWCRGVNCVYYVNRSHIELIEKHLKSLRDYIRSVNGKVKHCYPMNHLSFIEEEIGYVKGYYLFGSMDDANFCTREKSLAFTSFFKDFMDNPSYGRLNAVNMMGSKKESQEKNVEFYLNMRKDLDRGVQYDIDAIREIIKRTTKPIRCNYGSVKMRAKLKDYVENVKVFTLFDF